MNDERRLDVTIITGLSGAGRSEAAAVLEDAGFFVIDNLPPELIAKVADLAGASRGRGHRYAFVVDARSGPFIGALASALDELRQMGARARVVFLDASDDVLVRRYEESRRRHPRADGDRVSDGIARERAELEELKGQADVIIDTTDLNVHELADRLRELFAEETAAPMQVHVVSFGYKHGLPLDVDIVFDMRFLPNPHWVEELRPLAGTDPKVRRYVLDQPDTQAFLDELDRLFALVLPAYVREGKSYLSLAVGCTGGTHRSVVLADELAKIMKQHGFAPTVHHRDLERD